LREELTIQHLKTKCFREFSELRKGKELFMAAENYIMRSFIIFTLHIVSFRMVKSRRIINELTILISEPKLESYM
jgi:hypothetical protein